MGMERENLYQDSKSEEPDKWLKRGKRQKRVSRKLPATVLIYQRGWQEDPAKQWFLGPEAEHELRRRGKLRGSGSSLQPKLDAPPAH